jgi:hypothetical protein
MALELHNIELAQGTIPTAPDRVIVGFQAAVANTIGGGAGQSVTTAVAFVGLPASYSVIVTPGQDAVAYVTTKTSTGFNVVLTPRLAANTLAAGTFDVLVVA